MSHVAVAKVAGLVETRSAWWRRCQPRLRVLLFALVLATVGAGVLLLTPGNTSLPDRPWKLPFFALVIAFGVAEATALHVEIRKESHSLSLSAIPLMFGLLYVSPVELGLAYVLGAAPAMLWIRKSDWVKTTWNSCLFFAEAAVAALIVRSVLGLDMPANVVEWLVPLAAVLVAELMSLLAVPLVIMTVDTTFRPHLFADVGRSQVTAALAGTFTVIVVAESAASPWMLAFAAVPVVGVGVLLQSTGHLSQRYQDLQKLHTFMRALSNERGQRTLDTGLLELVQLMRAKSAGLLVASSSADSGASLRVLFDDSFVELDAVPVAELLVGLLEDDTVAQFVEDDPRQLVRALLGHLDASRVLAVRVLAEADRVGVLFVADRLGMRNNFKIDELRLFGSLANTLSARLSNDHLVERLEVQAHSDALTGLPNRLTFEIALTSSLSASDQSGVIVMVDLDRFKAINDSLGHETGDRLLSEIARRLNAATRASDMVARFGGDEFAILLTNADSDTATDFHQRIVDIHAALTAKVDLDGIRFEVGASFGVVAWPQQGRTSTTLLRRADTAMYAAKRHLGGVVWYTPEMDADAPRRLDLYLSASEALDNEQFFVHFQPKVSISGGHFTGAEALVRWTHPQHGQVPPSEFVPLIVQAGLSGKLTRFMVRRAAETAALMIDAGLELPIAVNLTARDLLDPTLIDDIEQILLTAGVSPTSLELEITEDSMVVDFESSVAVLRRLRHLGVKIAIDDFGTGYSSLQHIHRLPVDVLKIDRTFINRLSTDDSAAAIVRASIGLANELGLTTVAEGIEDQQSLQLVSELGCDEIQGFFVSPAVPAVHLLRLALERNNWTLIDADERQQSAALGQ